jgi:hypothetical protein
MRRGSSQHDVETRAPARRTPPHGISLQCGLRFHFRNPCASSSILAFATTAGALPAGAVPRNSCPCERHRVLLREHDSAKAIRRGCRALRTPASRIRSDGHRNQLPLPNCGPHQQCASWAGGSSGSNGPGHRASFQTPGTRQCSTYRLPQYAGHLSLGMNPALSERLRTADVIVAVGTRISDVPTDGYTRLAAPNPDQALIHFHPEPAVVWPDRIGA